MTHNWMDFVFPWIKRLLSFKGLCTTFPPQMSPFSMGVLGCQRGNTHSTGGGQRCDNLDTSQRGMEQAGPELCPPTAPAFAIHSQSPEQLELEETMGLKMNPGKR